MRLNVSIICIAELVIGLLALPCKISKYGCFAAGTPVYTDHGKEIIENITISEKVLSYNEKTKTKEYRPVTALKTYIVSAILAIVFNAQDTLWATPNHLFWHKGHYVEASALHAGDTIEALEGDYCRLQQIIPISGERRVYNITVAENSNYYVGNRGILVHNDCFLKRLTDSPELMAQIDALPDALKGQFIQDFYEAGEDVIKVLKERAGCVRAWEILFKEGDDLSRILRTDPVKLQKLDNYIITEGADINKLKSSFQNTKHPEVWLNLKKTQPELDELYVTIKNDPPANLDPWTPEHKAQRWNNYKEGNGNLSYESWSNIYDGNIGKAVKGKQKVIDYAASNNITFPPNILENTWRSDITINIRGQNLSGKRRHDIYDPIQGKAIEVKDYSTQDVSKSFDIEREALMDIKLLENGLLTNIEWVFLGQGPSQPLRTLLETGGISIIIK